MNNVSRERVDTHHAANRCARLSTRPSPPTHTHLIFFLPAQGVENLFVSKMLEKGTNTRTYPAARHAGVAVGGIPADGRQLAARAQSEAIAYANMYGDKIPGSVLSDRLAR